VLAPVVGIVGSMQALEALKLIGEFGEPLVGRLLLLDASNMQWREMKLPRDPHCAACGTIEESPA
jgi:adenylyltransferase/sulfurtransferase